jgi:hypothetical protein
MSKTKEYVIALMEAEGFEWDGTSENMNMTEYMRASGDTLYNISSTEPELLDFDFDNQ